MLGSPLFWAIPEIAYKGDPSGALLMIPPKVLMIKDVRCCYTGKIGEVGDMKIRDAYNKLYDNGVLREEYKIIEQKGLNCALDFLQVFKTKWIRIILSCIHDNYIWLEGGPIKPTKRIINRVSGYPTLIDLRACKVMQRKLLKKIQV